MSDGRPRYHVLPPANWLNDPNGVIQWKGRYHLFYQYNPAGPFWAPPHWGHAVSADLAHWAHLPMALTPEPGGPDAGGCWSGCAVDDDGTPTLLYTGAVPVNANGQPDHRQAQCLATSADDLLTWRKYPGNPVIPVPPDLDVVGFRDPCVWREDGAWYCAIGSGVRDVGPTVLLYRSNDLIQWEYLKPLFSRDADARDPLWTGLMWECPQFFRLGDKHVLLVGVADDKEPCFYTAYAVGSYTDHTFTPDTIARFDLGADFYAPIALRDDKGRVIVWGWSREARGVGPDGTGWQDNSILRAAGWAGVLTLPRILTLRPDGLLGVAPAPELHALRGAHHRRANVELAPGASHPLDGVRGDCLEIMVTIEPGAAMSCGLAVRCSPQGDERTLILYERDAGCIRIDREQSSLDPAVVRGGDGGPFALAADEPLTLHVFLDRSIVEVYANGRACLPERVYPSRPDSLGLELVSRGGRATAVSVDVWELSGAWDTAGVSEA